HTSISTKSNYAIHIQQGDLTTERVDVIVVSSSLQILLENIFKAGGDALRTLYNRESKTNPTSVTSIASSGQLRSKKVYFIPWQSNTDETLLCQSLKQFILTAIEKASNENYHSIAFPAIGCGQSGCSISLIAKTLVEDAHRLLDIHGISVSFIIQPDRADIYHEFKKQIDLLKQFKQPSDTSAMSVSVGKGTIIVEKGNITTQQVQNYAHQTVQ
ncbi:unnamed protein product, partial [Rotaria sp. Silwood2]